MRLLRKPAIAFAVLVLLFSPSSFAAWSVDHEKSLKEIREYDHTRASQDKLRMVEVIQLLVSKKAITRTLFARYINAFIPWLADSSVRVRSEVATLMLVTLDLPNLEAAERRKVNFRALASLRNSTKESKVELDAVLLSAEQSTADKKLLVEEKLSDTNRAREWTLTALKRSVEAKEQSIESRSLAATLIVNFLEDPYPSIQTLSAQCLLRRDLPPLSKAASQALEEIASTSRSYNGVESALEILRRRVPLTESLERSLVTRMLVTSEPNRIRSSIAQDLILRGRKLSLGITYVMLEESSDTATGGIKVAIGLIKDQMAKSNGFSVPEADSEHIELATHRLLTSRTSAKRIAGLIMARLCRSIDPANQKLIDLMTRSSDLTIAKEANATVSELRTHNLMDPSLNDPYLLGEAPIEDLKTVSERIQSRHGGTLPEPCIAEIGVRFSAKNITTHDRQVLEPLLVAALHSQVLSSEGHGNLLNRLIAAAKDLRLVSTYLSILDARDAASVTERNTFNSALWEMEEHATFIFPELSRSRIDQEIQSRLLSNDSPVVQSHGLRLAEILRTANRANQLLIDQIARSSQTDLAARAQATLSRLKQFGVFHPAVDLVVQIETVSDDQLLETIEERLLQPESLPPEFHEALLARYLSNGYLSRERSKLEELLQKLPNQPLLWHRLFPLFEAQKLDEATVRFLLSLIAHAPAETLEYFLTASAEDFERRYRILQASGSIPGTFGLCRVIVASLSKGRRVFPPTELTAERDHWEPRGWLQRYKEQAPKARPYSPPDRPILFPAGN